MTHTVRRVTDVTRHVQAQVPKPGPVPKFFGPCEHTVRSSLLSKLGIKARAWLPYPQPRPPMWRCQLGIVENSRSKRRDALRGPLGSQILAESSTTLSCKISGDLAEACESDGYAKSIHREALIENGRRS